MSEWVLPPGSTVIATVMRPSSSSPGLGVFRVVAASRVGAECLARAIAEKLPQMFGDARLPELLLPGAPLTLLLQVITPSGDLRCFAASADLDRAAPRADMLAAWSRDLPGIVTMLYAVVATAGGLIEAEPAEAPAPVLH